VKREWRDVVGTAKVLGMYRINVLSLAAGGERRWSWSGFTVFVLSCSVWTDVGELFSFGDEKNGKLGHGGTQNEDVPGWSRRWLRR